MLFSRAAILAGVLSALIGCASSQAARVETEVPAPDAGESEQLKTCLDVIPAFVGICYDGSSDEMSCKALREVVMQVVKQEGVGNDSFWGDVCEATCESRKSGVSRDNMITSAKTACEEIF